MASDSRASPTSGELAVMARRIFPNESFTELAFFARHNFGATQGLVKLFVVQGHPFLGLARYYLPVIGIIPLDQLGDEQYGKTLVILERERSLVFSKLQF